MAAWPKRHSAVNAERIHERGSWGLALVLLTCQHFQLNPSNHHSLYSTEAWILASDPPQFIWSWELCHLPGKYVLDITGRVHLSHQIFL